MRDGNRLLETAEEKAFAAQYIRSCIPPDEVAEGPCDLTCQVRSTVPRDDVSRVTNPVCAPTVTTTTPGCCSPFAEEELTRTIQLLQMKKSPAGTRRDHQRYG